MLWYGLLGVPAVDDEGDKFIYDYLYNMKRLKAAIIQLGEDPSLTINPALHVGLVS